MTSRQPSARTKALDEGSVDKRTCLLILGMHRSGTSALARMMGLLGADLPATLMAGTGANLVSNAKGHWESEPLARLNDEILGSAGISWRSPEIMPAQWYGSARFKQFRGKAVKMLESEFAQSPLFVFKDPRNCKLVPFWLSVLEKVGVTPAIVNMVRNPEEVANSLIARNALDRPLGILMWLRYVLASEHDSRGRHRVHVSYDRLLADWPSVAGSVAEAFDIGWPAASAARKRQISDFISESERHHRALPDPTAGDDVGSWAQEAYAIIGEWVERGETVGDHGRLDDLSRSLQAAMRPLMAPLLVSYEKSAAAQKLNAIRSNQSSEIERMKHEVKACQQQFAALAKAIHPVADESSSGAIKSGDAIGDPFNSEGLIDLASAIKAQRDAAAERIRSLAGQLEAANVLLARQQQDRGDLAERLAAEKADLTARRALEKQESESREARLGELFEAEREHRLQIEKQLAKAQRLNATLLIVRGRFEAASEELARLGSELEASRERVDVAQRKLAGAQKQAEASESRAEANRKEAKSLSKRLEIAEARLTDLQGRFSEVKSRYADTKKRLELLRAQLESGARELRLSAAAVADRDRTIALSRKSLDKLEHKLRVYREADLEREARVEATLRPAKAKPVEQLLRKLVPAFDRRRLRSEMQLVETSGLFDAQFYRDRYPDLQGDTNQLLRHYITLGGKEGRSPSAAFSGSKYLRRYPDVAAAGLNPLVHFLELGLQEGRRAFPLVASDTLEAAGTEEQVASAPLEKLDSADTDSDAERDEPPSPASPESELPLLNAAAPAIAEAISETSAIEPSGKLDNIEATAPLISPSDELSSVDAQPVTVEVVADAPGAFAALADGASDWRRSAELVGEQALRVGGIAVATKNEFAAPHATAALKWFRTLNSGAAEAADAEASHAVRSTIGDGRLVIEDAWISGDYGLRIRLTVSRSDPLVVRFCQLSANGEISQCSEQFLSADGSTVVSADLAERFDAVLLVLTDLAGRLIDSTLIPFPTLLRGGLHHGELIDFSGSEAGWGAHQRFASDLLAAFANRDDRAAVQTIAVRLDDANGTEPIFSESFRAWLARQFAVGVTVAATSSHSHPALEVLAAKLSALPRVEPIDRRSGGRALVISASSIPTLGVLVASEGALGDTVALRTIVVDEGSRRPLRAIDTPDLNGDDPALPSPFDPPLVPAATGGSTAIFPVAISFRQGDITDVRLVFPVADPATAAKELTEGDGSISVVVACNDDRDGLLRLLVSLAHQQSVSTIECLLVGAVPKLEPGLLANIVGGERLTLIPSPAGGEAASLSIDDAVARASCGRILLIDDRKVLHDPRTIATLAALCGRDAVGSAGCNVVQECRKKDGPSEFTAITGYMPTHRDRYPTAVTRQRADDLVLSPIYPIFAHPLDCVMIDRDFWPDPSAEHGVSEMDPDQKALNFGRTVIERGKLNLSTSRVTVSDLSKEPLPAITAPWLPTCPPRFISLKEY